jgi:soluble lytic murein transglycosylase
MLGRTSKILLCCALAAGGWLSPAWPAAEDALAKQRELFQQAYADAQSGVDQQFGADSSADAEQLRDYPLYPYLEAARIQRAVRNAAGLTAAEADRSAETFLLRYTREPVARPVRRAWLSSLAQRREWETFLAQYQDESADETLRCHSFTARIELQRTAQLQEAVTRQWLIPRSTPACEPAFEWLRAQNLLSPELIERRARLALAQGNFDFARQMTPLLPPERAVPLNRWIALLEQPAQTLDTLIALPAEPVEPEALLAGFKRLARQDRDAAMLRFDGLEQSRGWTAQTASRYALALALGLAWDRRPETLQYFSRVLPADLDDEALEWQARAALWAGDWTLVARSIAAMSAALRQNPRWRYWEARTAEQLQDKQRARELFESVLSADNFYSAMAAARLDRAVVPHVKKLRVNEAKLAEVERLPTMVRARELYYCKLRSQAAAEWNYVYAQLSEAARAQAIHLSSRWGWHDQAITVAAQRGVFNDYPLLYPRPYRGAVRNAAKLTGLESEFIYGVMRQESLYRSDAVSPAGARGLLQLLPETAQRMAKALKQPRPHPDDLFKPEVNIVLGASQLRTLTEKFGGMRMMALAGYNAGPNAARRWLPDRPIDSDIWVENIPYNETRGYVQRVLWHSVVFAWLRTGEGQKTDGWIASVTPKGAGWLLSQRLVGVTNGTPTLTPSMLGFAYSPQPTQPLTQATDSTATSPAPATTSVCVSSAGRSASRGPCRLCAGA